MGDNGTRSYLQKILETNKIPPDIEPEQGELSINLVRQAMSVLKATVMANSTTNISVSDLLGYNSEDLIISCMFDGVRCGPPDFYFYYTYEYGRCYVFNHFQNESSHMRWVSQSGPGTGLQLELFSGSTGLVILRFLDLYFSLFKLFI